jgi:acyl carrier protein
MDKNELLNNEKELLKWVKEELIFKRLNLSEIGLTVNDVGDETLLFQKEGLDLDSVDGLELAVGIEQKLGLKVGKLKEDTARVEFATARSIRDYILELHGMKSNFARAPHL